MPVDGKIEIRKTVGEIVNLEKIIAEPEFDAPVDDKKFRVKVDAAVSQTFFGWVFQYNGGIAIVEPIDVKQQYEDMLNRALQYSESINLG